MTEPRGLPLIRRAEPQLIAQEIVSVQPMAQPLASGIFYQGAKTLRRGRTGVGKELLFRVKSIEGLHFLLEHAAAGEGFAFKRRLLGHTKDVVAPVAEFAGVDFRILDGLGQVDTGIFSVEHLPSNEAYEEFLLSLTWRSACGWPSGLHVLALEGDKTVEGVFHAEETEVQDA